MEFPNESLMGQISPDKRLVVIKIPCQEESLERDGAAGGLPGENNQQWPNWPDAKSTTVSLKMTYLSVQKWMKCLKWSK